MYTFHRAFFNGHKGYYDPKSGSVKFGSQVFPSIEVAIKYLNNK
jgi:hypothetical protein